jgi:hypothetical protein
MSDTIQLDSLDDFEEDTLVDLHLSFSVGTEGDVTRVVEFAELARMLDVKATI